MACVCLLFFADFPNVLLRSNKRSVILTFPTYALSGLFCAMWAYASFVLFPRNPRWYESFPQFIKISTGTVVLACFSFLAAFYADYGILVVPLLLIIITFVCHATALLPLLIPRRRQPTY